MPRGTKRVAQGDDEDEQNAQRLASASSSKRQRGALGNAEARTNAVQRSADGERSKRVSSSDRSSEARRQASEGEAEEDDDEHEEDESASGEEEEEDEDDDEDEEDELVDDSMDESDTRGEGSFSAVGTIERISLTNFMCHNRLVIDLGSRLNFVVGHNGSGKSAILTGITIALGAKASATSRGTSVKSLVKEGKDAASIEVTIKNSGADAYKPEVFGDRILVERIIRADGASSWKIKSKYDKVVSSRRDDLDAILDHANIQVDNPLNVLTQDSARQFLTTSNPNEMYNFFLRGTQLSQLSAEYDVVSSNIKRIVGFLKQKEEGMKDLKANVEEATARHNILNRALEQRAVLDQMKNELVWAQVEAKEAELEDEAVRLARHTSRLQKCKRDLDACEEEAKRCDEEIQTAERMANVAKEEDEPMRERHRELRGEIKEHTAKMRARHEEEQMLNRQYQRIRAQLEDVARRIEAEVAKNSEGGRGARKSEYLERRKQLQLEADKVQREEIDTRDRMDEIDQEINKLEMDRDRLRGEREDLRNTVGTLETEISRLRSAKSNHISAYGPKMPRLMQLVQAERRWNDAVIGPLGSKIKLIDPKWAPVLESVIGNTLNAFCVTNYHDRARLVELRRQAQCDEVPILTGSREMFDYSAGEPDQDVLTVLRVLRIDDEFVKRQLINAVSIERSALVERRADGDILMRSRPRNIRAAFSLDLFRIQYEAGGSSQALQPYRGPPRLSSDVEERLQEALRHQPEEERKLQKVTQDIERVQNGIMELQEERRGLRQRLPQLQREARTKHAEVEKINDDLREDEPANTAALFEAQTELEKERESMKTKFSELREDLEEEGRKNEPLIKERDEIQAKLREREEDNASLKTRLQKAAEDRLTAITSRRHYETQLEAIKEKVNDQQKRVDMVSNQLTTYVKNAEEYHARVPVQYNVEEYEKRISALEAERRQADRQQGTDLEAIKLQVDKAMDAYEKAHGDIAALKISRRMLQGALDFRMEKWFYFRRAIALRAKNRFSQLLNTRGFEGTLGFDHNKMRLLPRIKTDSGGAHSAQFEKDPRSLSGGEKSYSTICLLLALWEAIGCPIRCLDEFDVFMDAVNRRIAMSLIMNVAKKSIDTQYILITPQNITHVTSSNECRIHRLADPERNQTTLT